MLKSIQNSIQFICFFFQSYTRLHTKADSLLRTEEFFLVFYSYCLLASTFTFSFSIFFCCCMSCRGCFPKMEIKITSNLSTCSPHTKTVWSNLHVYLSQMFWYIKSSTKNMCVMKKVVVRENKQWQILKIKRENSGKTFVIPCVTCVSTLLIERMCVLLDKDKETRGFLMTLLNHFRWKNLIESYLMRKMTQ